MPTVPAARIPADPEARLRWLQDNWAEMDAWIGRHQTDGPPAVPKAAQPSDGT
jgi:hypothetical protein